MSKAEKKEPGLVEQLRDAIRQSGQSLNQVAKLSGVGSDQLSRFMTGKRDLTLKSAEKVCRVLHLHLTSFGAGELPQWEPKKPGRPRKQPGEEPKRGKRG